MQKIGATYSRVNIKWLILGEGQMFLDDIEVPTGIIEEIKTASQPEPSKQKIVDKGSAGLSESIESIVHHYKDGTFKIFKPR